MSQRDETPETIIECLEQYAKYTVAEQLGSTDVAGKKEALLEDLADYDASVADVITIADYLTGIFAQMLQNNANADAARFELLVRAMRKNRVLSNDVLDDVTKQLKAINDEALRPTLKEED